MYPSLNQFLRWAGSYKAIPVWIEPELPSTDLLEWAHALSGASQKCFLLHSASADPQAGLSGRQARYSYLSLESPPYTLQAKDGCLTVRYGSVTGASMDALKIGNPFERFMDWLTAWTGPRVDGLPPFWGGAVGYFGYESARFLDPKLASVLKPRASQADPVAPEPFPDFEFGLYDMIAAIDHVRRRLWLIHTVLLPERRSASPAQLERMYRSAQDRLRRQAVRLQKALRHGRPWGTFQSSGIRSNRSEAAYQLMVRRAKGHIAAGDIYQSNLSQSLSAAWKGDPWALYQRLTAINPSPYAALWRQGSRWIVSASPELLLRQEADQVETRPIAGTFPRGRTPEEDQQAFRALVENAKERAEHIMLVDLERNDLSRVCASPSVQVAEALTVETYSHVFHLVSDIRGRLRAGQGSRDLIRACFPGGTITGCPKIRCMELIRKLERSPRGPYSGSLGWLGFNGDLGLNILIRTFFLDRGHLHFPVGAGIVADSSPAREYQETLHKAAALIQALQAPVDALRLSSRRMP